MLAFMAAVSLAACATTSPYHAGQQAERMQDYDAAVVEYNKAARAHPDDRNVRAALDRARLRAAQEHFNRGRRLANSERHEEALGEFQIASELNPTDSAVASSLKDTRQKLRTKLAVSRDGKTELQTLIDRTRDMPAAGMELPKGLKLPDTLTFSNANSRMVFSALARFADLNLVFDPAFRDVPVTIDLRNATLEEALASLTSSTQTFFRVTSPRTITIVPDTTACAPQDRRALPSL